MSRMPLSGWTETTIAGHPADVFEPPRPHPAGLVVLYLHGVHLNRLVDNQAFSELFVRQGLKVVAPMTGPTWWLDRLCPAFDPHCTPQAHLLSRVLPWIAERWQAAPPQIGLLGTSMGGQGALRLAFQKPQLFPVVAALAPAIDFQQRLEERDPVLTALFPDRESARQDTAILHIHALNYPRHIWFCCDPTDDLWYDGSDRLRMKLFSLGIPHQCDLTTTAGGHGFGYYNHMAPAALQFLVERLEAEQRRVG